MLLQIFTPKMRSFLHKFLTIGFYLLNNQVLMARAWLDRFAVKSFTLLGGWRDNPISVLLVNVDLGPRNLNTVVSEGNSVSLS